MVNPYNRKSITTQNRSQKGPKFGIFKNILVCKVKNLNEEKTKVKRFKNFVNFENHLADNMANSEWNYVMD